MALKTFTTLADSVGDANPAVDSNDAARRALMIWSLAHGAVHPLENWAETFAHYLHIDSSVCLQRWLGRETITPTPCNAAATEATPMWFGRPAEVRGSVDSTMSAAPSAVAAGMFVRRCDHADNARKTRLDTNEA